MKRILVTTVVTIVIALLTVDGDAWARAKGGGGGGRGSRSYSAPAQPSSPTSPGRQYNQPTRPNAPAAAPAPSRGFFGGLMGGMAGFMLGGLIGSLLFGGLGGGFGGLGGIGLFDILLIGGGIALIVMFLRRRQASRPTFATAGGYGSASAPADDGRSAYSSRGYDGGTAVADRPSTGPASDIGRGADRVADLARIDGDRERGVGHIRQMDPSFNELQFATTATALFMRVQAAWQSADLAGIRDSITPELAAEMQAELDHLRSRERSNRVEQIDVERAEVTEAWQETGQDFVTVFFSASMLDYTVDARGGVVDGSRTAATKVEEFWTFTRPVGANRWKLSAIQQPA